MNKEECIFYDYGNKKCTVIYTIENGKLSRNSSQCVVVGDGSCPFADCDELYVCVDCGFVSSTHDGKCIDCDGEMKAVE